MDPFHQDRDVRKYAANAVQLRPPFPRRRRHSQRFPFPDTMLILKFLFIFNKSLGGVV